MPTATYQTFRTSAPTNRAIRTMRAEVSAALNGANIAYDELISACVQVAGRHREEVLAELTRPTVKEDQSTE